jgi:hypothetical protein
MPDREPNQAYIEALHLTTELAREGRLVDGYNYLLTALERAKATGSPEQVRLWEIALERYAERFGVRMEAD